MKTKVCSVCAHQTAVAYRVQIAPAIRWVFVCPPCLPAQQTRVGYRYGGTWKGSRH
ncbi:MAG: hypothetical protein V4650_10165 [Pseudomonadota bacterium]